MVSYQTTTKNIRAIWPSAFSLLANKKLTNQWPSPTHFKVPRVISLYMIFNVGRYWFSYATLWTGEIKCVLYDTALRHTGKPVFTVHTVVEKLTH